MEGLCYNVCRRVETLTLWPAQTPEELREYKAAHPKQMLLTGARARAKTRGIPCTITEDDFDIPEVCPYLKTPFIKNTMYAASLGRIIPSLGYIQGNVEVISRKANVMKNDAPVAELLKFAYTILERH